VNVSSLSAQQVAAGLDLGASLRAPAYSVAKYMLNALGARATAGILRAGRRRTLRMPIQFNIDDD
jgi:hypothetical protein